MNCLVFFIFVHLVWFPLTLAFENDNNVVETITWCTVGAPEQFKCGNLSKELQLEQIRVNRKFIDLKCKQMLNKEECIIAMNAEEVSVMSLDAGQVFYAGRFFSLLPIAQEIYGDNLDYYFSVAVIKKGTLEDVAELKDLKGKSACFSNVNSMAGWTLPVYTLMKKADMKIIDCNNHIKNVIEFFGPSCAINSLSPKNNPLGDNSNKLCQLCIGKVPYEKCSSNDPYEGFDGAFRCLRESGQIAFLAHNTIELALQHKQSNDTFSSYDFELLCIDGSRKPVEEYMQCNWGKVPTNAIITTSALDYNQKKTYQRFFEKIAELYSNKNVSSNVENNANFDPYFKDGFQNLRYNSGRDFNLFESVPKYGRVHDLLVSDKTVSFRLFDENDQNYKQYLKDNLQYILDIRECNVKRASMCVTSDAEMEKCRKMKIALESQLIQPTFTCFRAYSKINCMNSIQSGYSDVTVLDASDIYTAGKKYDLVPIISEVYDLDTPEYYVVAVVKENDPDTEFVHLKNKATCHGAIDSAAGWVLPMAYLKTNNWIRNYECNPIQTAAEYFTKSCIPGALSSEYNFVRSYDNLCDLCHGKGPSYCRRDASEDYFGHTGAFRCLVEGGGQVAFVKHTTVTENTNGKRRDIWARNWETRDFELLCPGGGRAKPHEFKRCNLGTAKANAIVTRGGAAFNQSEVDAYVNLFMYTQQLYGRKQVDDFSFSMFSSKAQYSDLIFQDATQKLHVINETQRHYLEYLDRNFIVAHKILDCDDYY